MSLNLSWREGALKDLEKLEIILRKRIIKKILEFVESGSFQAVKRMQGMEKTYRLRVGYYRVIFELEENDIIVLKIGHRKNIY